MRLNGWGRRKIVRRLRALSPLEYVRVGTPQVLMIHGDADPAVPYQHTVLLKTALDKAGVPNRLFMAPAEYHGGFTPDENVKVYGAIKEFLKGQGLPVR
jgi:dipeptidyl aminopeptidase/acylaminoacyl peptidase